ncbi:MAG: hypothetical protein ACRDQE_07865 [Gaiellales bacterium]
MSEFDPKTRALLDRLAPATVAGPEAWADVVRRSETPKRWRLTSRRTLVLALAVAALAAASEDGTATPAARGPGWFAFLVDPARLRPGHRPVGVDFTRTDGTRLRRFDFFPGCIRPLPEDVHGVPTSCDGEP